MVDDKTVKLQVISLLAIQIWDSALVLFSFYILLRALSVIDVLFVMLKLSQGDNLYGKLLVNWLQLVISFMVPCVGSRIVLCQFPRTFLHFSRYLVIPGVANTATDIRVLRTTAG